MANKKSAAKRYRQSVLRRLRNRQVKSEVKTAVKKFTTQADTKQKDAAAQAFLEVQKLLDSAGSKGVLHKKTIARKKSRLARRLNSLG